MKNKTQGVNRNFNCKSTLNIKFLKTTQSTLKSSVLLIKGYNVVIDIHFSHSHRVNVAQSLSLLRCSNDTKQIFTSYFDKGMTAAAAKMYHELNILSSYENDTYKILANAQHNPLDRQIVYL